MWETPTTESKLVLILPNGLSKPGKLEHETGINFCNQLVLNPLIDFSLSYHWTNTTLGTTVLISFALFTEIVMEIRNSNSMTNTNIYESHMVHFCDSSHRFRDINILNLWPWKFRSIKVTEYNIFNGPVQWQIWTSIKVILKNILLALTVFEIFTFQNLWPWKGRKVMMSNSHSGAIRWQIHNFLSDGDINSTHTIHTPHTEVRELWL